MNNIDIVNGIVFQELGISNETFESRLISQKKIYILQKLGTDLGYDYNWYVRGPYSPSLTNYIYNNIDVLSATDFSNFVLSQEAQKNIDLVNSLLDDGANLNLSPSSLYELFASLLYIQLNANSWHVHNKDEIFNKLIHFKPKYNIKQCEEAFSILQDKIIKNQEN